jgi:hypothetical protein
MAQAQHGSISIGSGRQSRCGYNDYPVSLVNYSAQPGYRGYDDILITTATGWRNTWRVLVE